MSLSLGLELLNGLRRRPGTHVFLFSSLCWLRIIGYWFYVKSWKGEWGRSHIRRCYRPGLLWLMAWYYLPYVLWMQLHAHVP